MKNPVDKPIIRVWDSMMGDGKTTQAIAQINSNPELRYIIIVRYITEIERIKRECKAANLVEPTEQKHAGKTASFHELLQEGKSIVMTHELYRRLSITEREKKLIREYEYRLYMDETADVIEPLNITSHDLKEIFDRYVEVDDCGLVKWKTKDYKGNHALIKRQIESKAVIFWNNSILLWLLPIDLIESFCEITIMTFMFEASHMKAYLDIHCLEYEIWHINNRKLVKGRQDLSLAVRSLQPLISIYSGVLNSVGVEEYSLSYSWYTKKKNEGLKRQVFRNASNILKNKCKASVDEAQWTAYKTKNIRGIDNPAKPTLCGNYMSSFVPCNCVATNDHCQRKHLAYLINRFENPVICGWFLGHGVKLNQDASALSELLQWIWRSAIRNGEAITLYIPSKRMRTLLIEFLETGIVNGHQKMEGGKQIHAA